MTSSLPSVLQAPETATLHTVRRSTVAVSPVTATSPILAVVIPTFNERDNVLELLERLSASLSGIPWEVLFVDDDSPDGTAELVATIARSDPRVRLLQRIGRRGLSSACIEGMLATTARYVAVMDADMQHDERILPVMLARLQSESLDLVVGTRNADGGSMGDFSSYRRFISQLGQRIGHSICRCPVTDPMSGFFLLERGFFLEVARDLHGGGFKILLDILSSATRPVHFAEIGYTFRLRRFGDSKLDVSTAIEYLFLIIHKLTAGAIPTRFVAFAMVGLAGLIAHLVCASLLLFTWHRSFLAAQIIATYVAMTVNFFLNNLITWRDRSLRGLRLITGLASFWIVCSFGMWADVLFARVLLQEGARWYLAAAAGIVISSVWNYSMANLFTWQRPQDRRNGASLDLDPVAAAVSSPEWP